MAKCYKVRYINKIKLFFEFQKRGVSTPRIPPSPPRVRHCLDNSFFHWISANFQIDYWESVEKDHENQLN